MRPDLILIYEFPFPSLDPLRFKSTEYNFLYARNSFLVLVRIFFLFSKPYDVTAQADNTLVLMILLEAHIFHTVNIINSL